MREWMKQLTKTEKQHLHDVEFLFGHSFEKKEDYEALCQKLPKEQQTVIGYTSKREYFQDHPELLPFKAPRKKTVKCAI